MSDNFVERREIVIIMIIAVSVRDGTIVGRFHDQYWFILDHGQHAPWLWNSVERIPDRLKRDEYTYITVSRENLTN